MLHWVVTSCSLIVTLPYDIICDVIQHMLWVYKGPSAVPWGDLLIGSPLGKEVHMCTKIDVLVHSHCQSLLPSNKTG